MHYPIHSRSPPRVATLPKYLVLSRINSQEGQVQYQLLDSNGLPLPHFSGGMNSGMYYGANYGMNNYGMVMGMPPSMAPVYPPATGPIAIVGDKFVEKEDKWTEYKVDCGTPFFHNPAKGETTWEKPKDFDKQKNAGNPPPPTEPKPDKKKAKYSSGRPSTKSWIL